MRTRPLPLATGVVAAALAVGVIGIVSYRALADEGREIPDMPIYSYDIGDNAPRVVGWCFGADAIYQANQSDGLAVVGGSANCVEGGILAEERP